MIDLNIKAKKDCMGCYACSSICPQDCITMENDEEGFWYPIVDYDKCIECGLCIDICPIINKKIVNNTPKAYACNNKNESVRLESSSGGIFTLVAEEIINNNGVVFGVGFDEDFKVAHSYIEGKKEINSFRGSKYVQSKIGDTYKQVKSFLEKEREVLFTGTPCQVSGLKSFLMKEYDNLICMDNICHGVPSPKVWDKYISYREKQANSSVNGVNFRSKDKGWIKYTMLFTFKNDERYREHRSKDLYMKAFLKDVCLRPSCYDCEFKTLNRESDITLADFWGIQNILPEIDDDKGTSLIFVNSDKGQTMFTKIKDNLVYKEVDINQAVSYNSAAIKSVAYNPKRKDFFGELDKLEFDKLVKKYCPNNIIKKIKRKIVLLGKTLLKKTGVID